MDQLLPPRLQSANLVGNSWIKDTMGWGLKSYAAAARLKKRFTRGRLERFHSYEYELHLRAFPVSLDVFFSGSRRYPLTDCFSLTMSPLLLTGELFILSNT